MHARAALCTAIAIIAATLTACSGDDSTKQGTAERATASAPKQATSPDCGPGHGLSQTDWAEQCADEDAEQEVSDDQPDTELAVGDTFAYTDGIKVKVTSVSPITRYGEYDEKPDADQTAFRVTFTVTNGTKKPYDLDGFGYNAQGATTGGEAEPFFVEADSKEMTGRLAPGRTGTFTAEYAIAKSDGKQVLFTMTRTDDAWLESGSYLGDDPNWTGKIK